MKNVVVVVKVSVEEKEALDRAFAAYLLTQKELCSFSEFIRRTLHDGIQNLKS